MDTKDLEQELEKKKELAARIENELVQRELQYKDKFCNTVMAGYLQFSAAHNCKETPMYTDAQLLEMSIKATQYLFAEIRNIADKADVKLPEQIIEALHVAKQDITSLEESLEEARKTPDSIKPSNNVINLVEGTK